MTSAENAVLFGLSSHRKYLRTCSIWKLLSIRLDEHSYTACNINFLPEHNTARELQEQF